MLTMDASAAEVSLYATWSRRAAAWLVDTVLVVVVIAAAARISDVVETVTILFLPAAYATVCHGGRSGQTAGKWLLGLSVRHEASLGRLGYPAALGRWLVALLLWVLFLLPGVLDALWPLWDEKRRALHDRAAGSVVVRL